MAAKRILLIEDEPGAREALSSLLAEEGYEVCAAATGERGLAELHSFHPDTVVCDFRLPDIDGLQILRTVRDTAPWEVCFIVVTAGCGGEETEHRLADEADYFFRKPIDIPRLCSALASADDPGNSYVALGT
jgi:CheY-like chemotaxis protein